MKQIIKDKLPFFLPYILIWLCIFVVVMTTTKFEQMSFVNAHNNFAGDWFFYAATQLGEGWFWAVVIVVFLFISYDKSIIIAT
jgi:hypothetical protein